MTHPLKPLGVALGSGVAATAVLAGLLHLAFSTSLINGNPRGGEGGTVATTGAPPAAPPQAGAPAPAATSAPTPAPAMQAAPAAPRERTGTDFVQAKARWESVLEKGGSAQEGATLASAGSSTGAAACVTCHGPQAVTAASTFPRLAGLSSEYIAKQLVDYQDGTRAHPIMTGIAKALSDTDVAAVAKFYGSEPAPAPASPLAAPGNAPTAGALLHTAGDMARALPACANCHGMDAQGTGPLMPGLFAQPSAYISAQLTAFRGNQRANDDGAAMRSFAARLSDQDIASLADYYGLRP